MPSVLRGAREIYNQMRRMGLKQLFHTTPWAENLMTKGIDPEVIKGLGESWKPNALYWAKSPLEAHALRSPGTYEDLGYLLNYLRGAKNEHQSKDAIESLRAEVLRALHEQKAMGGDPARFGNVDTIRGLVDPKARIQSIDDYKLAGMVNKADDGVTDSKEIARRLFPETDILEITGVDGIPNLSEHLQINPGVVHAFWKDKYKLLGGAPLGLEGYKRLGDSNAE